MRDRSLLSALSASFTPGPLEALWPPCGVNVASNWRVFTHRCRAGKDTFYLMPHVS